MVSLLVLTLFQHVSVLHSYWLYLESIFGLESPTRYSTNFFHVIQETFVVLVHEFGCPRWTWKKIDPGLSPGSKSENPVFSLLEKCCWSLLRVYFRNIEMQPIDKQSLYKCSERQCLLDWRWQWNFSRGIWVGLFKFGYFQILGNYISNNFTNIKVCKSGTEHQPF